MQIGVETSRAVENKRIFVVDDDEIIRAALQFMLHDEYETHEVASLAEAFDEVRNDEAGSRDSVGERRAGRPACRFWRKSRSVSPA